MGIRPYVKLQGTIVCICPAHCRRVRGTLFKTASPVSHMEIQWISWCNMLRTTCLSDFRDISIQDFWPGEEGTSSKPQHDAI